jgi:hypothetical protein
MPLVVSQRWQRPLCDFMVQLDGPTGQSNRPGPAPPVCRWFSGGLGAARNDGRRNRGQEPSGARQNSDVHRRRCSPTSRQRRQPSAAQANAGGTLPGGSDARPPSLYTIWPLFGAAPAARAARRARRRRAQSTDSKMSATPESRRRQIGDFRTNV